MKFNPKQYQGKHRLHRAIPGYPRISRLYVWNEEKGNYESPPRGKAFFARKKECDSAGNSARAQQYFETLQEANSWLTQIEEEPNSVGVIFAEVVNQWRKKKLPLKAFNTQIHYEKMLRLNFGCLMNIPMDSFRAKTVDAWIDRMKDPEGIAMQSKRRINFGHELSLLSGILTYYREYIDNDFVSPILRRHHEDVETGRTNRKPRKDLSVHDFFKFREKIKSLQHGEMMAALATVQYFQGLRISEAAAIHHDDVRLDESSPQDSRLLISRSIIWPRKKGLESYVSNGFKNADANDGMKEQPLFPDSYDAIQSVWRGEAGPLFQLDGKILEYRQIQYAYDTAFKLAGLPYRGTHVMRHGGTRFVYNSTKDLDVAKQFLGNRDMKTVAIYAQREVTALSDFSKSQWKKRGAGLQLVANEEDEKKPLAVSRG